MNSDTVFSLLKLEAWHSSKSTTRMSRRVSVLKLLACPPVPGTGGQARSFSTETLLDILVVLFDECQASSLRREKTVSEFIELGKAEILMFMTTINLT